MRKVSQRSSKVAGGASNTTRKKVKPLLRKSFAGGLAFTLLCAAASVFSPSSWGAGQFKWHVMQMVGSTYPEFTYSPPLTTPAATKATCGTDDRPEPGLQGQTTVAERFAPGGPPTYNCNLYLASEITKDGSGIGPTITYNCAFMSQYEPPELPKILKNPGLVVIDVKDSAHPRIAGYLETPGALDSNETADARSSTKRNLLIMQAADMLQLYGKTTDIYDVSDCDHPVLKFSGIILGEGKFKRFDVHMGIWTRDGKTYWAGSGPDADDTVTGLDVSDPSHPRIVGQWHPADPRMSRFHDVAISDDGNTLYVTMGRHFPLEQAAKPSEGILALDVSEVQARKPNAEIKMIGKPLVWEDDYHNQWVYNMVIRGHHYVLETNRNGAAPFEQDITGRRFTGTVLQARNDTMLKRIDPDEACRASGKPAFGYASIIDVENPSELKRVGAIKLQVSVPEYCLAVVHDPIWSLYGYGPQGCDMDDPKNTKMIVCGWGESGLRVFDVRDVKHIKEIAYYKPKGVGYAHRTATFQQTFRDPRFTGREKDHPTDASINAYFAKGGREIWFFSSDNGFQVLRFSDAFMAKHKELFAQVM